MSTSSDLLLTAMTIIVATKSSCLQEKMGIYSSIHYIRLKFFRTISVSSTQLTMIFLKMVLLQRVADSSVWDHIKYWWDFNKIMFVTPVHLEFYSWSFQIRSIRHLLSEICCRRKYFQSSFWQKVYKFFIKVIEG